MSAKYIQLDPDTTQRFANKEDIHGNKLFEGDIIKSTISRTVHMEICYGRYGAFCPNDQEYMENISLSFRIPPGMQCRSARLRSMPSGSGTG